MVGVRRFESACISFFFGSSTETFSSAFRERSFDDDFYMYPLRFSSTERERFVTSIFDSISLFNKDDLRVAIIENPTLNIYVNPDVHSRTSTFFLSIKDIYSIS